MLSRRVLTGCLALLAAAIVFGMPMSAQAKGKGDKGKKLEKDFTLYDTNNDGKLSPEEFGKYIADKDAQPSKSGKPKKPRDAGKLFGKLDTNKDGFLSLDEFKKLGEQKKKKKPVV